MIPPEHFEYAKINVPDSATDEDIFLERFLTHGIILPVPDEPAPQFYMPGRIIADLGPIDGATGPYGRSCKFLFVAVAPDFKDYMCQKHFASQGPSTLLKEGITNAGIDLRQCYYTTIMRFPRPLNSSSYKQCWLKQGWQYFLEEVQILRPDAICFLGSESLKQALGQKANLESVRGQVFQFQGGRWACPAMAVQSHMNFVANTAGFPAFVKQLIMFKDCLTPEGSKVLSGTEYPDRDYKILWTPEDILAAVDEDLKAGTGTIAIDVETATDTGRPDDTYLISFQWSSRPGHARLIPFLMERPEPMLVTQTDKGPVEIPMYGGAGVDKKSINDRVAHWDIIREQVIRLLDGVKRVAGHNLRYDLIGLRDEFDIDIRKYIVRGIFDTMQAYHCLEKDEYGLKQLVLRYTDMGAYDAPMHDWIDRNAGKGKLFPGGKEDRFFHGFRDICYKFLLPYAMCDTDGTIRLVPILEARLAEPGNEGLSELYYGTLMPLNSPVIDIESTGLPVDLPRAQKLSKLYQRKYAELIDNFRSFIEWSNFNVNSPLEVPALLYGGVYKKSARCNDLRPTEAYHCKLTPPWETGKFGKNWDEIEPQEYPFHSPSCEAKALRKLMVSTKDMEPKTAQVLEMLCEIKDMKQFVSLFMRDPVHDELTGDEHARYGKGLLGCVLKNGRMRTQLSLLSETHRWKHRAPNLANLPKNKEESIQYIFAGHVEEGDEEEILAIDDGAVTVKDGEKIIHIPKVRTIFVPLPGWRFIEADWKSAELWAMGMLSKDAHFCHVLTNEPDMHLHNAIQIFNLDCMGLDIHDKAGYAILKKKYKLQRFAVKAVCLAAGTPVLTETRGFVPIEQVLVSDRVWDGLEWVSHEGLVDKGIQETIEVNGIWLTPDHKILTDKGMVQAWQATSTPHQLSARHLVDGRLLVSPSASEEGSSGSSSGANAAQSKSSIPTMSPTCSSGNPSSVSSAASLKLTGPSPTAVDTKRSCLTRLRAAAGSIGFPLRYLAAGILLMIITPIMAAAALLSAWNGESPMGPSWLTFRLCLTGITLPLLWIVLTTRVGTNQATFGAFLRALKRGTSPGTSGSNTLGSGCVCATSGSASAQYTGVEGASTQSSPTGSPLSKLLLSRTNAGGRTQRVYDLYNAGASHRFQAGDLVVSNCFGMAYGLGAPGLADQMSLEFGRFVSVEEAQKIVDGYFVQYPGLKTFFDACKLEVAAKGYVETPFLSRRYFPGFYKIGRDKQAKMQREGMNSKIQGCIAIMLDKASVLLDQVRYDTDIGRQIGWEYVLAVHDAMYVHCPEQYVETTSAIVKWVMQSIIIPGPNKGLEVDLDVLTRWGE